MEFIVNALKDIVLAMIGADLTEIFGIQADGLMKIQADVTITPDSWLGGAIWQYVSQIAINIMIPIATMILTLILTIEIYHQVMEKNAMKEVHIPTLMMYFFKMAFGVILVANATTIVPALFDIGNWAVQQIGGIIPTGNIAPVDLASQVVEQLRGDQYGLGECFTFWLSLFIVKLLVHIINIVAMVVVYGRLIQMVIYASFSPVPLATMMNKDWNVGQNYLKNLLALAFQGFLIIFIFGIYSIVISNPVFDYSSIANLSASLFGYVGWGVLLVMALLKTNSVTQSIFGAH